jgi:hypothetical protein
MSENGKSSKIVEQIWGCRQTLLELEARAGIAKEGETLRTALPSYERIYDAAEPHSDEQKELERAEEKFHEERTARHLRNLYFRIGNIILRKELIAKHREIGELDLEYKWQELSDARSRLELARSTDKRWWVWASIFGVVPVGLGFLFFGLVGSLGGLLVGYFIGRRIEHEALRARDRAIAEAELRERDAEQTWNKARNKPQTFSRREANTGERDPDN